MTDRYSYSLDEMDFIGGFATREEAIAEATEVARGLKCATFWTGESVKPSKSSLVPSATMLAEMITERMALDASDVWDDTDFPDATTESIAEMGRKVEAIVEAWAAEHVSEPDFFRVEDVQEHTVPTASTCPCGDASLECGATSEPSR